MNDWGETLVLALAGFSFAVAGVLLVTYQRRRNPALLRWARITGLVAVTLVVALVGWFMYLVLVLTGGSS